MKAYESLVEHHQEIGILSACSALLSWDQETNLPPKGISFRARQRAAISERIHALKTQERVGQWLDACDHEGDTEDAANVRWWRHEFERSQKIPSNLVGELEQASSLALAAWQSARETQDFQIFEPHLAKIIDYKRQMADRWGYEATPYDALLEEYERGARTQQLTELLPA